jgi:hypothetical protein
MAHAYLRRQLSDTLLNEQEIKVSYHHRFWVIFVLLQESGHGKYNGAVKCELIMRLGMGQSLKYVLVSRQPDLNMLACRDNLSAYEL